MINEIVFLSQTLFIAITGLLISSVASPFLIVFITIQLVLANLLVSKQIILFGLHATCAESFSVGIAYCLILLQEKFDKKMAQIAIFASFLFLIIFAIITQFHLAYQPSNCDLSSAHFQAIFELTPHITSISILSFLVAQIVDVAVYRQARLYVNQQIAAFFSIAISQLIDTTCFTLFALRTLNKHSLHIIFVSYTIKMIACTLMTGTLGIKSKYAQKI